MGERVNIQFSVDIDELPVEVNRLFEKAISRIQDLGAGWGNPRIELDLGGLGQVETMRDRLSQIDSMLADMENIISGYVSYRTRPATPVEPEPQQAGDIEQALREFQRQTEALDENPTQEFEETN
jgi:hypothetical protein